MGRFIAALQGLYYIVTAAWPFIHLQSFLAVTGPKEDIWLVYTVSLLILMVGLTLAGAAWSGRVTPEIIILAVGSALSLTGIDVVYVFREVIREVYLLDAIAEMVLVALWGVAVYSHSRIEQAKTEGRREHVGPFPTSAGA